MIQYRAALVITGAIKGTSCYRLYQEIGLESLADRRLSRKIFSSIKLWMDSCPPTFSHGEYQTRSACQNKMKSFSGRTEAFNSSFYPYSIKELCALSK